MYYVQLSHVSDGVFSLFTQKFLGYRLTQTETVMNSSFELKKTKTDHFVRYLYKTGEEGSSASSVGSWDPATIVSSAGVGPVTAVPTEVVEVETPTASPVAVLLVKSSTWVHNPSVVFGASLLRLSDRGSFVRVVGGASGSLR